MFEQSVTGSPRKPWSFAVSLLAQTAVLALVLAGTLMYTPLLPAARFAAVLLEPPPPPPGPPPAPPERTVAVKPQVFTAELVMPDRIPDKVAIVQDPTDAAPIAQPYVGVPGGDQNGSRDGVIGAFSTLNPTVAPPKPPELKVEKKPAPPPAPSGPVEVSKGVQAARLVHRVEPVYPPLAKQAHVSGAVRLRAVIAADGTVESLQVLSGHPLLIRAAADAIQQWRYRPTMLSGRAVPVSTEIEVNFVLR
ncbi:MAG: TonB family protein [Chrysiogenetes bacterium]|nr:TonB family protein [Chrysiogenetes bacterium]